MPKHEKSQERYQIEEKPDEKELKAREVLSTFSNKFSFGRVTIKNVGALRVLNSTCLPVHYRNWFYDGIFDREEKYARIVSFNDILVGGVVFNKDDVSSYYIMSFSVLKQFRRCKIGTYLMNYVLNVAKDDPAIKRIHLNVHVINKSAIDFYMNAFGFVQKKRIEKYYKTLKPSSCYELEKEITH
ncbi:putative acetyltransferase, GNAT family protein [Monocercomonoides exilis]|uniref:putative acetyltransferase, GNAT family protein n=1 Tax=Monocercomonoides exilis TaxID=2049356 RepID=UPI003559CB61|nr:putative acetyltransferase, GNAT family protein [Monocercomonoides exilis]|eukprot:MONOS_9546.1-p1 / transcript=MONOS_9546.1 / gene=MONOS_9546 / organism=Monocercomonoides_exilis_PA203 / gene_product=acetyltransferase, GNAT family protein / transcript_product=acetyltransferase, GNAT family protein / location=Mono_scaffold00398:37599-38317(+) / protein_length=184 / sequence_SO=supercontig / SO=protein_coding / is_pseudo=false